MHFVCSPFGSSGDVHPMVGLALALRARGHRVTMIGCGYFEPLFDQFGLDFQEIATRDEFIELAADPAIWHPRKAFPHLYRVGVEPIMRRHYEMLAEHQREGPIVAVTNLFGFGAMVAREKLGIPVATLHLQPSVIWSDVEPPELGGLRGPKWLRRWLYRMGERWVIDATVCPSLNAWRSELGLPPVQKVTRWWHSPDCTACLFPDWFASPQPDWPPSVVLTDFPLWDERTSDELPSQLTRFLAEGTPPIAFTPGSANVFGASMFDAAAQACQTLGQRGLLLTRFPEQLPKDLPAGVKHFAYAPFSQLLPHVAALVHHGGIGSMSQAMAAGVPQLVIPMAHDQFDNGRRLVDLGIGRVVTHRQVTPGRLQRELGELLGDAQVAAACRRVAERFQAPRGLSEMAAELERRFVGNLQEMSKAP